MSDIAQEARAEAEKHFDGTYGPRWRQWPDDQQENSISDYAQGYIDGASRLASPATDGATYSLEEFGAMHRYLARAQGDPMRALRLAVADATPATRETVTERMVERAARVLMRDYEAEYDAEHVTWHDFADVARAALEAALIEGGAR